ncbi:MAG: hypothetical protein Q8M94_02810 [Ignavibacteria bacterium]|nr:hypothetical protein [Ignavibacteria bacterium]
MCIFKVVYSSMTAHYSRYVEAKDEVEAKRKFANGAFSEGEIRMMTVRPASIREIQEKEEQL